MKWTLILLMFAGCSSAAAEPAGMPQAPDYITVADAVVAARKTRAPILPDDLSGPAGRAAKAPPAVTAVHVYSPRWCAVCKRMERETARLPGFTFTFDADESAYPAWVRQINSYPISVWSDSRGRQWHKAEWRGVDWFIRTVAAAERGA